MTNDDRNAASPPDWNRLAKDAFDLWQAHFSTLAADPKAKEDMALLVAPMTQMYAAWTDLTNKALQSMTPAHETAPEPKAETAAGAHKTEPVVAQTPRPETPTDSLADTLCFSCIADSTPETPPAPSSFAPESAPAAPARALPAEGARNLAELATRLASLEHELERLRAKKKGDPDNASTPPDRLIAT